MFDKNQVKNTVMSAAAHGVDILMNAASLTAEVGNSIYHSARRGLGMMSQKDLVQAVSRLQICHNKSNMEEKVTNFLLELCPKIEWDKNLQSMPEGLPKRIFDYIDAVEARTSYINPDRVSDLSDTNLFALEGKSKVLLLDLHRYYESLDNNCRLRKKLSDMVNAQMERKGKNIVFHKPSENFEKDAVLSPHTMKKCFAKYADLLCMVDHSIGEQMTPLYSAITNMHDAVVNNKYIVTDAEDVIQALNEFAEYIECLNWGTDYTKKIFEKKTNGLVKKNLMRIERKTTNRTKKD